MVFKDIPLELCITVTHDLLRGYLKNFLVDRDTTNQMLTRQFSIAQFFFSFSPNHKQNDLISSEIVLYFIAHLIRRLEQWQRVKLRHPEKDTKIDLPFDFLSLEKLLIPTFIVAFKTADDDYDDPINNSWLKLDPWFKTISIFSLKDNSPIQTELQLLNQLERRHLRLLRYRTFVKRREATEIYETLFRPRL